MNSFKITQKREKDMIKFYYEGWNVATLYDGHDSIVFDELAYLPRIYNADIGPHYIEENFKKIGLGVFEARYMDECPIPDINSKEEKQP